MGGILDKIVTSYYFRIFAIIYGFYELIDTLKNTPRESNSSFQPFVSGIFASLGSIILVIVVNYLKIVGEI
jgi:hypothetical protein